jgi:hypothetical protein
MLNQFKLCLHESSMALLIKLTCNNSVHDCFSSVKFYLNFERSIFNYNSYEQS